MNFKWIDTTGGPFIALKAQGIKKWSGSFSIQSIEKQEFIIEEDFLNPVKTHYGQACQIYDDIGVIDFDSNAAIVISQPFPITLKKFNENILLIFQWEFGKNKTAIEELLRILSLNDVSIWSKRYLNLALDGNYVLFDSAILGFDLKEAKRIKFELAPGSYLIESGEFKPNEQTFMKVFKLEKQ